MPAAWLYLIALLIVVDAALFLRNWYRMVDAARRSGNPFLESVARQRLLGRPSLAYRSLRQEGAEWQALQLALHSPGMVGYHAQAIRLGFRFSVVLEILALAAMLAAIVSPLLGR
ncbi:hypothetical protein GCM10010960_10970 [Arenimonas maotaiensis]|uniref:Uncharacterized protein n=1 Tax=Arenimonas maotaiensis TaxID=1446479 RepID=A0A917CJK5_9GAMM|nr:hypothetical protein [Arenimonas maotaiensis]GGF90860.1 hypothetical protein GCM10010960_10970 [Arenimonas maotaiensis]